MVLHKITRNRDSKCVILPMQMMRDLLWQFGDYVAIDYVGMDTLTIRRVKENKLTDAEIQAARPESEVLHE